MILISHKCLNINVRNRFRYHSLNNPTPSNKLTFPLQKMQIRWNGEQCTCNPNKSHILCKCVYKQFYICTLYETNLYKYTKEYKESQI